MAKTNTGRARAEKSVRSTAAAPRVSTPRARAVKATKPPKLPKSVAGAVSAARDKKATDVVVLDLRKAGGFTDYFVICTGNNARQITAIADAVTDTLKKEYDERPALAEGVDKSEW